MNKKRYKIFKERFNNEYIIYVDIDKIDDMHKIIDFMKYSKYHFKPYGDNNIIDYVLQHKRLNIDEKYCFQFDIRSNSYTIQKYSNGTINNSRDIILSYTNEKDIVLKILGIYVPNYKPKRIKRTI
jgi:hypothetical protein